MSILVGLQHVIRYEYGHPAGLGPQIVRLRPAPHSRTAIKSYSLSVSPSPHFVNWQQDPNGNWLARYVFPERMREFVVAVDLLAELSVINPFDFFVEPFAERFPFAYPPEFAEELAPYLDVEPGNPRLANFIATVSREPRNAVEFLVELNQRIKRDIAYVIRMDPGV